jgi:4-amino-4-deoxy-L-arabinose transferase-like glycosyltransferase
MKPSAAVTRILLALVILVPVLLSASTWRVFGHTWDEPEHLAAGIELLDRGRYEYDTEHPPIGRIMMAIGPYLAGAHSWGTPPPDGVQEGVDILYRSGHYDEYLTLARLGMMPFFVLLLLSMWLWARRIASTDSEALLAVALLATVPPIVGHAALAALDVAAAGTTLLALYWLQRWIESGQWREAALFGLTSGLAVATKFSSIPFIALGLIVLAGVRLVRGALDSQNGAAVRRWPAFKPAAQVSGLALAAVVGLLPIVMAYGIHSADPRLVTSRFNWAVSYLFRGHGWAYDIASTVTAHLWLPRGFKLLVEGVVSLKAHNDTGHVSFLLGRVQANGWWYFYLVALAVKTPLPLLVSGPIGLGLMTRDGWRERDLWRLAPLVLFVTLLAFASAFSHINIGVRHMLILYPFLALGGAYLLARLWRALATVRNASLANAGRAVIVVLVGWQVSLLWTAYPDYLPYFNETVSNPQHVLVDSDLDWGQDLRRLEWALAELKVKSISLAYAGTADLAREPLPPLTRLPPGRPAKGWVAITALAREHNIKGYAWLDAYKPIERIGRTIDLYFIPESANPPTALSGWLREKPPAPSAPGSAFQSATASGLRPGA